MDLTVKLAPAHWAALELSSAELNDKTLQFHCVESRPGHEQEVSCQGMLKACRWQNFKDSKERRSGEGIFWAGVNLNSLPSLKQQLQVSGIKLDEDV